MPAPRILAALATRFTLGLLVLVLGTGCAFGSSPPPRAPAPRQTTYATWEFDTLGELDQLLDIKGCEGWRLAEAFVRGEKIVAIIVSDGTEPPPADPACRPSA